MIKKLSVMGAVLGLTFSMTSCTPGEKGAVVGGVTGAAIGGAVGDGTGALIGGAAGAIAGSSIAKRRAYGRRY